MSCLAGHVDFGEYLIGVTTIDVMVLMLPMTVVIPTNDDGSRFHVQAKIDACH